MRRAFLVSVAACLLVAAAVGASAGNSSSVRSVVIKPSPVYTKAQLNAYPADNWLMNMGNLTGQRYSKLTQINKNNVTNLKLAWKINLGTCQTKDAACGSLEANAVVADGVYYIQTPKSEVFALDAATGQQLWKYTPQYEPGFNVGTGGRQPGVAIGEGKVFAPRRDGYLVALDQILGGEIWKREILPWRKGGRLSAAPIYYNGMVLIGDSGGDGGSVSNAMHAVSAANGRPLWTWTVVPQPGAPGSETWAATDTAYGGGAMWESPVIDSKLGVAIFGTGNPVPWNSRGPGKNLWTDSIVALNVYTGQLVWGYQTAHHDLWDADLPNNPIIFTAKYKVPVTKTVNGKRVTTTVTKNVRASATVSKYGWTYILDNQTGKPLPPGVREEKVPQLNSADVNTWPTQPIPLGANVLFNKLSSDGTRRPCTDGNVTQTNAYVPFATATAPNGKPFKIGCVFDPYDTNQYVVQPFEMMDWPASSYSPENKTFITCGVSDRARGFLQTPKASQVAGAFGGVGVATGGVGDTSTSNSGNFSALDVRTSKLTWHQHWEAPCYSGSMNTAGGLTFIGHLGTGNARSSDGYLEAVDTKTGKSLWRSAPMSAGVGAAPVTYTVNGKQYVSVAVGGQAHNDVSRPFGLTDPRRQRDDAIYTYALP